MSEPRRRELLRLSETHGVPIFEDECYSDLTWDGKRPQALRGMAGGDRVIHIGSFSKTIAPALRVGYIVAGWPVLSRILPLKTDGGTGAIEQMVLAEYCNAHFDAHVADVRRGLRRKLEVLMGALREHFADAAQFEDPPGGPFLWVKLPDGVDTTRLTQIAQRASIAINPGADWMTDAEAGKRRIRLCFANPTEDAIREGVAHLAEVCHREFGVPTREAKGHR